MEKKQLSAFPPKKILVPLDLTEASVIAWRQAKSLAASFGARVEGLFVQGWVYRGDLPPLEVEVAPVLAELRRKLDAGEEIGAVTGSIEETIASWGRHLDYDLIVMGTHGRTGLHRLLWGSVAEAVIRSASVPVLIVRKPVGRPRTVLAPVNFRPYSMTGLQEAGEVARALAARLTVLHVLDAPVYGGPATLKGPKHLLADAINRLPLETRKACRPTAVLAFGDAAEQIGEAAKQADLVVLVAHRKGFLNDLVLGTTVERLLRHCDAAILALPAEKAPRPRPRAALRTLAKL